MPDTPRLRVRAAPVRDLLDRDREAMWKLYAQHYDHVSRDAFDHDLAEKTAVFLGHDRVTGAVGGFSTARFYLHRHAGGTAGIYFSGDTLILPEYWGERGLHKAIVAAMMRWRLRHPLTPLYWHLICSGYRTYLTMVRNFPEHWPHHARPTPPAIRALLESVCRERYGSAWRPDRGVVSIEGPQAVLKATVAPFTPEVFALPEIAFFVNANPGYWRGDELAMLAPITSRALLYQVTRRITRRLLPGRVPPWVAGPAARTVP